MVPDGTVSELQPTREKKALITGGAGFIGSHLAELLGVVVNGVKSSAGGYFKRNIQATHEYQNNGQPAA